MNVKKKMKSNQIALCVMPSSDYNNMIIKNVKALSGKTVCYITLNKTQDSLKKLFKKHRIKTDSMVFIDAITRTVKKNPDPCDDCYYCESPGALTELSLVISKFLEHDFDYVVFDSLTNMTIYQKDAPIAKFVSSMVNKIKESKTKALIYCLDIKGHSELVTEAEMFADTVLRGK